MQAIRAQVVVPQASSAQAKPRMAVPAAVVRPLKALGAGVASLALALSANAATVKVGSQPPAGCSPDQCTAPILPPTDFS